MSSANNFVHLHVHTQYSLLDGACHVKKLVKRARELGMPALAITDHGTMFGAVSFYLQCKDAGIKSIIGIETYVAPGSYTDRVAKESPNHLVLLVKNDAGYANLIKMATIASLDGFYYKPRIDKQLLAAHSEGLIGMSACLKGEISQHILAGNMAAAMKTADSYRTMFAPGDFYLEIMENGIPEQKIANQGLIKISKELGIPLVATNDVHYLKREHAKAHEILLCLQTQTTLDDANRMKMSTDEFYLKTPEEMTAAFSYAPQAVAATMEIADKCDFHFDFKHNYLPRFPLPEGKTDHEYLEQLCRENIPRRYGESNPQVEERMKTELAIIRQMGFSSYFLIVWDLIHYSANNGISVGPGRGSAAGSIVSYLLGITQLCPLKYNLLFERFLNPQRVSMPDIDIDFCFVNRYRIVDYVAQRYGQDHIAQIITFGTMQARAVVRDVGRAMGLGYGEVDKIAKMIPQELNMTIEKALDINPEFAGVYKHDERIKELIDTALVLEGLSRHASVHAAGTVIGDKPLIERVPLYKTADDQIVTAYDMKGLEKLGLLKMDFLGLKTITMIDEAVKWVKKMHGVDIDWDAIGLADGLTFRLLQEGDTLGVFQIESSGMRELLRKFKPTVFEDVISIIALYRPGPLQSGMVDDFILRKQGAKPITFQHPMLESVLRETYGVIVYQEQVMQIASHLGGFSMAEADELRRAMGKKLMAVMDQKRVDFVGGCRKNGIPESTAVEIYELMVKFAEYGFNKSHSAAYALVTYRTAYLKANYPREFMAALLTIERDNTDKIVEYVAECKNMGISVLPPEINQSFSNFTVTKEGAIRFGLSAVKNVGEGVVDKVIAEREKNGVFQDLFDFCSRLDSKATNKKVIESLIRCGAMDSFGKRSQLMAVMPQIMDLAAQIQKESDSTQMSLFGGSVEESKSVFGQAVTMPDVPEWEPEERLQGEKDLLGFYITGHPLDNCRTLLRCIGVRSMKSVKEQPPSNNGTPFLVAGVIEKVQVTTTRKKKELMAIMRVEDGEAFMEALVFPKSFEANREHLKSGQAVVLRGNVGDNEQDPKLIVELAVPVADIPSRIKQLSVYLGETDKPTIPAIKDLFVRHSGNTEVHFHFQTPELKFVRIKPRQDLFVTPHEALLYELARLLGPDKVCVDIAL